MNMRITKTLLIKHKACEDQVDLFAKTFPKGVVVTKTICEKYAQVFNFGWAAQNLLTPKQVAEYEKNKVLAWAEYEKKIAIAFWKARAEYEKKIAIAFWKASLI